MKIEASRDSCLACGKTDHEVPLLTLSYGGATYRICPQCLPTLIHAPQKLVEVLPGLDRVPPAPHHGHKHS